MPPLGIRHRGRHRVTSAALHALWLAAGWVELVLLTLLLYLWSFLPPGLRGNGYRRLFHFWSRVWVHALGVDLRLHHKNPRPLPSR